MNPALLIVAILLAALILWLAIQISQSPPLHRANAIAKRRPNPIHRHFRLPAPRKRHQSPPRRRHQLRAHRHAGPNRHRRGTEEHPRANPPASGTNRRRSRTKPRPFPRHAIHRKHSRRHQDPRPPRRSHPAAPPRRFSSSLAIFAAVPLLHRRSRRCRHLPARQKTHGHRL